MTRSRSLSFGVASLLVALAALLPFATAFAHERRQVGQVWMVVGFLNEPAFLNGQNGLDLTVYRLKDGVDPTKQTSADRLPITGLEKTLKAEVIKDGKTMPLKLTARFNVPGSYNGVFFPTAGGDYTFHISGAVEGQNVDEKFTSGNGFNAVEQTTELQFPVKASTNQDLDSKVTALQSTSNADKDDDDSNTSLIVAIVGVALGLAGLAVGGVALTRGRNNGTVA